MAGLREKGDGHEALIEFDAAGRAHRVERPAPQDGRASDVAGEVGESLLGLIDDGSAYVPDAGALMPTSSPTQQMPGMPEVVREEHAHDQRMDYFIGHTLANLNNEPQGQELRAIVHAIETDGPGFFNWRVRKRDKLARVLKAKAEAAATHMKINVRIVLSTSGELVALRGQYKSPVRKK